MCVCVRERERESVCERERERETERVCERESVCVLEIYVIDVYTDVLLMIKLYRIEGEAGMC